MEKGTGFFLNYYNSNFIYVLYFQSLMLKLGIENCNCVTARAVSQVRKPLRVRSPREGTEWGILSSVDNRAILL